MPLSPELPSLDGRLPVPRERAADAGERTAQRHAFGRLLDRFAQSDCSQDPAKDPLAAPQDQRPRERRSTDDEPARPLEDAATADTEAPNAIAMPAAPARAAAAPVEPAQPALEPAPISGLPTPSPVAIDLTAIAPVVAAAPAKTAPMTPEAVPAISTATAIPAVAAAAMTVANGSAPVAAPPLAAAAAKPAAIPGKPVAETTAAAEPAADTPDLGRVALPTTRARRTAAASGATIEPTAANATPAEKPTAEIAAPQLNRPPAAPAESDMPVDANSNQDQPQFRIVKGAASAAAADVAALAGAREERTTAQSSADQAVASLTGIDSPRRTAALYHRVADAARPGADTPTPADQVSIRLIHAVAEGRRAIQMHLHPAELGSIDVKMQWQGDRLTAQFTVDRPETLQILQREVPALERSLGQAGVNVDSGSLSFSLRQQQGNGQNSGGSFDANAANATFGDGEPAAGDEPLGQVIRDGILSIRV
jgi:flagellar hook-length control protein FliK